MVSLPIDQYLPRITSTLAEARSLVIVAEPGAGKTTRVPPAILRANLLAPAHPNLLMLQPRRIAARASAQRIADENGWQLGGEVGYQIRFEKRIGPSTRLRVFTEGILTRQLLDDPFLEGVGCVVLDEFHERSLFTDLAAAMLREVRATVREDLLLVVMSATLDAEPAARFLGDCPIIRAEGRTFPIDITHLSYPRQLHGQHLADAIVDAVGDALAGAGDKQSDAVGDILVFLPGAEEIRRGMRRLEPLAQQHDLLLIPLHGSLPADEQILALRSARQRKVVLATNIAETSLTIDGVRTVIDSGLARVAGYDPQRGMDRLDLMRISKASATQRAGRAGRTAPGRAIRLWTAREHAALPEFEVPEVKRVDLSSTVLSLHAWGQPDPRRFGWYEPPDEETLLSAERLLAMLGALTAETAGQITPLGRRMLALPAHPRVARLLIAAAEQGMLREGATLAALLSEKDIEAATPFDPARQRMPKTQAASDLLVRMQMLEEAERERFSHSLRDRGVDPFAARQVARVRDELERIGRRMTERGRSRPHSRGKRREYESTSPSPGTPGEGRGEGFAPGAPDCVALSKASNRPADPADVEQSLLKLALLAYPDRVCRRRGADPLSGVMVGGRGVRLRAESVVHQHEFFLALDARQDERSHSKEALVRIASGIEATWLEELFPHEIRRERQVMYDEQRRRVVGRRATYYLDLLLREDQDASVDPQQAANVLADLVRPRAAEIFAADESAANWLARLALLRRHMPEHPWPALDAAQLGDLLADASAGKRSLDEVRRLPLVPLLAGTLHYPLDRLFEQHAPQAIEVPTGSRIRLQYSPGQPPVLAVRLQEIFGWTDTPRIAAGRVPVLLHLLGPNYRPVQITDDLRSFWSTTYFQVRKDLRVRYPRHSWPEDPLTAKPEAKGGRKRR